ncbi:phospho-sugar mutase [bacterium]|nr:MAG: phospho-sugar mutase [bacterium]
MTNTQLRAAARAWLQDDPDPVTRAELQSTLEADDLHSLREGFAARLQFGTAGLRGVLGPGPGRMNRKLVREVTRGVADALLARDPAIRERGVVVGADARRLSPELAEDTARVFAGAGIRVHRFVSPAATPVIAWLQKELGAGAAVIVTASHNPPEYNGYKVYVDGAAQIIPPLDREISAAIDAVGAFEMPEDSSLIEDIDEHILQRYYDEVLAQRRHPEADVSKLHVVATPLHGVGGRYLDELFTRAGYEHFELVRGQSEPDGEFPTVRFPNPEEPGALDMAMQQAQGADLILANDPDADRLAVALPDGDGFHALSGNEIGCLLAHWLMTEGESPEHPLLMTTIVSSRMLSRMAEDLGAHYDETLTGFKWIAHRARALREQNGWSLVLGYEEALGYTVGETVADKDGISAALLFAEMAAVLKARGETVAARLDMLYAKYGLHRSLQHSLVRPGSEGVAQISAIMQRLRAAPPESVAGTAILRHLDWTEGLDGLPTSNVLGMELEDGGRILVRPSGTEPKIKFYLEIVTVTGDDIDVARAAADVQLCALRDDLLQLCGV